MLINWFRFWQNAGARDKQSMRGWLKTRRVTRLRRKIMRKWGLQ